jgi:hypothetical protein
MSYILDETHPPPDDGRVDKWERGPDPFHADALPDFAKSSGTQGARRMGWSAIDWCGNMIGWLADGTEYTGQIGSQILVVPAPRAVSDGTRCERCDKPVATQEDWDRCDDGCECEKCVAVCWQTGGCARKDWRAEVARLRSQEQELARLRGCMERAYMTLPLCGEAMEWTGDNIESHARRVADEFAILRAQRDGYDAELSRLRSLLREARDAMIGDHAEVSDECKGCAVLRKLEREVEQHGP